MTLDAMLSAAKAGMTADAVRALVRGVVAAPKSFEPDGWMALVALAVVGRSSKPSSRRSKKTRAPPSMTDSTPAPLQRTGSKRCAKSSPLPSSTASLCRAPTSIRTNTRHDVRSGCVGSRALAARLAPQWCAAIAQRSSLMDATRCKPKPRSTPSGSQCVTWSTNPQANGWARISRRVSDSASTLAAYERRGYRARQGLRSGWRAAGTGR